MSVEKAVEDDFQCSLCEVTGEITFSSFNRQSQKNGVRVWVRNLPEGISERGLKNLFLTVGKPLCISFNPKKNSALVTFELMNEAELAVRDLHHKRPYNLRVTIGKQHFPAEVHDSKTALEKESNPWDFSVQEDPTEPAAEDGGEEVCETALQTVNVSNLEYDPSVRMRQRKLDYKTRSGCVSMGRGYMYMGEHDQLVGDLKKCEFTSINSRAKDKMSFRCENCEATTTKICGSCNASYCSKVCLSNSEHCSALGENVAKRYSNSGFSQAARPNDLQLFPKVAFTPGCTVVMSSYKTMQTVFVRRSDGPWEERFARLCNAVVLEAIKGGDFSEMPEEGAVVAAKYHEDLCFYRARVLSKSENKFRVFFIDFGNTQESHPDDLKPLPDCLKSLPGYAAQVRLKDVTEDSSLDSVSYFNKLTAERIPLIMKFANAMDEVVLTEKDSKTVVNKAVIERALPSWKRDDFSFSRTGEIYYLDSMERKKVELAKTCSIVVSHFDEREFSECDVFWVTLPDTEDFLHVYSSMRVKVREYCDLLKNDFYLPRVNELCLAKEMGDWHRCVNLQSHKTTCCLFYLDDGHSSVTETKNIRKMVQDFTEAPSQVICCVLPGDSKLKADKGLHSEVVKYLKQSVGQKIDSVCVLKIMGDAYCLSIPRINEILER